MCRSTQDSTEVGSLWDGKSGMLKSGLFLFDNNQLSTDVCHDSSVVRALDLDAVDLAYDDAYKVESGPFLSLHTCNYHILLNTLFI